MVLLACNLSPTNNKGFILTKLIFGEFMKKLLSALMIASVIGAVSYSPKSKAGIGLMVGGAALDFSVSQKGMIFALGGGLGLWAIVGGGILVPFNPVLGVSLIILGENGDVSQDQLENIFSERYSFIGDREVFKDLALNIKNKAKAQKPDVEGKILVYVPEAETRSILYPLDLSEEEINVVTSDLK